MIEKCFIPESLVTFKDWVKTLNGIFTPDFPLLPHWPNCSLTEGCSPKIGLSPLTTKSGRLTPDSNGACWEVVEKGYLFLPVLIFRPNKHSVPSHELGNIMVTSLNWPGVRPGSDFVASYNDRDVEVKSF